MERSLCNAARAGCRPDAHRMGDSPSAQHERATPRGTPWGVALRVACVAAIVAYASHDHEPINRAQRLLDWSGRGRSTGASGLRQKARARVVLRQISRMGCKWVVMRSCSSSLSSWSSRIKPGSSSPGSSAVGWRAFAREFLHQFPRHVARDVGAGP